MHMTKGLALLALWSVLVAALLEIGLRLAVPLLPERLAVVARWVMTGAPYAESWTPAWQENIDHYYALRPGLDHVLQYGSPSVYFHLSTIELWEGGGIGFRTRPVDYFVDAVAVGDSFTLCFTEESDCWVNILANSAGLGMVNLGQPVTGSTSHARILAGFGEPLKPPLVIWQFFGNDFNDDYGLAVFRGEVAPVETPPAAADHASTVWHWLRTHSVAAAVIETALAGQWGGLPDEARVFAKPYQTQIGAQVLAFGGLYEQQALDMRRPQNQIGLRLSREALADSKTRVEAWDGTLVVVLIPTREEVYARWTAGQMGAEAMQALASAREAMLSLCDELALLCLDLLPGLQRYAEQGQALYFSDDMHLNPRGNAALAALVETWLAEHALLPLSSSP